MNAGLGGISEQIYVWCAPLDALNVMGKMFVPVALQVSSCPLGHALHSVVRMGFMKREESV